MDGDTRASVSDTLPCRCFAKDQRLNNNISACGAEASVRGLDANAGTAKTNSGARRKSSRTRSRALRYRMAMARVREWLNKEESREGEAEAEVDTR